MSDKKKKTTVSKGMGNFQNLVTASKSLEDDKPPVASKKPEVKKGDESKETKISKPESKKEKKSEKSKSNESVEGYDVDREFSFESLVDEGYSYEEFKTIFATNWKGIELKDLYNIRIDKKFERILTMLAAESGTNKQSVLNIILYEWMWSNKKSIEKFIKEQQSFF